MGGRWKTSHGEENFSLIAHGPGFPCWAGSSSGKPQETAPIPAESQAAAIWFNKLNGEEGNEVAGVSD